MKKNISLSLASFSLAFALAGCSDPGNAQLNQDNPYFENDVDYNEASVLYLSSVEDNLYDHSLGLQFSLLGDNNRLYGMIHSQNSADLAFEEIKKTREAIKILPVPEEVAKEYSNDLDRVEALIPQIVAFNSGMYEGKLEQAYRVKFPERFAALDEAEANLIGYNALLSESLTAMNLVKKNIKLKEEELYAFRKRGEELGRNFFNEHQIPISARHLTFRASSSSRSASTREACVKESGYHWIAEYKLCHSGYFSYENKGLHKNYFNSMTSAQQSAYMKMIEPMKKDVVKVSHELTIFKHQYDGIDNEYRTRRTLAENQFDTERRLKDRISNEKRALNRATNGGYSSTRGLEKPAKGRHNPRHNSVFREFAQKAEMYEIAPLSSFNAKNAHSVYSNIVTNTQDKIITLELDTKGRFNIEEGNALNRFYFTVKTEDGKGKLAHLNVMPQEKKYSADLATRFFTGNTITDYKPVWDGFNARFRVTENNKYRDLRNYVDSL